MLFFNVIIQAVRSLNLCKGGRMSDGKLEIAQPGRKKSIFDVDVETCSGHILKTCPQCVKDDHNRNCPGYHPIAPDRRPKPALVFFITDTSTPSDPTTLSATSVQT